MSDSYDTKLDYVVSRLDAVVDACNKIDKDLTEHKAVFDAHLAQDERMYQEFKRMNDILAENTESLKEHMRRTTLLEKAILNMENRLNPIEIEFIEKNAVSKYVSSKVVIIAKIAGAMTALGSLWMLIKNHTINL
jgi:hypothetical protein